MTSQTYTPPEMPVTAESPRQHDPERTKNRRTRGPRSPGRPLKSGARALARHLAARDLDGRTWIAQDFHAVQDALANERGGWENTSTGERVLFEIVAAELLICRSIFAWVAQQPAMVEQREDGARLLGPLAKGYTSHAAALTRAVQALGLRPDKVERLPSLQEYLQARQQISPAPAPPAPSAAPAAEAAEHGEETP